MEEQNVQFTKCQKRVQSAFTYSKNDLLRNIAILIKSGKEVPKSVTVKFTINLEDAIDVEVREIKDEDKK